MSRSIGIVVPAFEPDVPALTDYIEAIATELDPETIRVELDAPAPGVVETLDKTVASIHAVDARRGKGAAITDGFEALETDVLAFADADGSTPAPSIAAVVEPVENGECDLAAGSRRHPDADVRSHQTVLRQHLGDVFAWLARQFLDVQLRDYQCGAKALSRETWRGIRDSLYEPGFAWDIEVVGIASALGYTIEEIPVTWEDHPDSTVTTTRAVPELLRALISVRKRISQETRSDRPDHTVIPKSDAIPLVERDR